MYFLFNKYISLYQQKRKDMVNLVFRTEKRTNYMSLADMVKDLTTDCLVELLPTKEMFDDQMTIMKEIELREELSDERYFELLETCNGK